MITKNVEGKYELDIFRNFIIDKALLKYEKVDFSKYQDITSSGFVFTDSVVTMGRTSVGGAPSHIGSDAFKLLSFDLFGAIRKLFYAGRSKWIELHKIPVYKIFQEIGENFEQLNVLESRLTEHTNAMSYAKSLGQTALYEDLKRKEPSIECESVLFALNQKEYIEEATMIKFALACERGLRLDWIKNFTRLIPRQGADIKCKLDKYAIFDNYVILHYDPKGEATKLTTEERKKKEDPILFGVISGSRRLYHIYSWKDEYCDLTFDQITSKYPEEIKPLS